MSSISFETGYDWINVYGNSPRVGGIPFVANSGDEIEMMCHPMMQTFRKKPAQMIAESTEIPEELAPFLDEIVPIFKDENDSDRIFNGATPSILPVSSGAISLGRTWEGNYFATTHFGVFFEEMRTNPNYLGLVIDKPSIIFDGRSELEKYNHIKEFLDPIVGYAELVTIEQQDSGIVTISRLPLITPRPNPTIDQVEP